MAYKIIINNQWLVGWKEVRKEKIDGSLEFLCYGDSIYQLPLLTEKVNEKDALLITDNVLDIHIRRIRTLQKTHKIYKNCSFGIKYIT